MIYVKEMAHIKNGLANSKCVGQSSRLETQVRTDVAILSLKFVGRSAGWKLRQEFHITAWRHNSPFSSCFRENKFLLLGTYSDWMRLTHTIEGNLL